MPLTEKTTISTSHSLTPEDFLRMCFFNGTGCDFSLQQSETGPPAPATTLGPGTLGPLPDRPGEKREPFGADEQQRREEAAARVRACFLHGRC
jgi:hypothetical protein